MTIYNVFDTETGKTISQQTSFATAIHKAHLLNLHWGAMTKFSARPAVARNRRPENERETMRSESGYAE